MTELRHAEVSLKKRGLILVTGCIDLHNVVIVREQGEALLRASSGEICISLEKLNAVNTAAVSLMLSWLRFARERQLRIRYQNIPRHLRAIIRLCDLESLLVDSSA